MDKLKMHTPNRADDNFCKLAALFPNAVTETIGESGEVVRAIDKDVLMQEIATKVVDGPEERYQFTWPDKKKAILTANAPINKTLRPSREESVDFDSTENLYIEGDNLEVLKLLQETYLGKVKMIYIDPPYNTGNDFVYEDDFAQGADDYIANSGQYDEEGNRLVQNTESNGRFHTDWLNMIYPRLRLAKDLLADDGVIFISIDNNELVNTVKMGNEVFGESNYITTIANINNPKGRSDDKYFATAHEYIVVYKNEDVIIKGFEPEEKVLRRYNKKDDDGRSYRFIDLRKTGDSDKREDRPNMFYSFMYSESTKDFYPTFDEEVPEGYIKIFPTRSDGSFGRWRTGIETAKERLVDLCPVLMPKYNKWTVMEKDYLTDDLFIKSTSVWNFKDVNSERGTEQFVALGFEKDVFPRPKPLGTILRMLRLATSSTDIILDFFSGSATTAHAVMQLNAEDGGQRKFIMVQLPEETDEMSEAYKAGYKNICEIGKERIRRAGARIKDDSPLTTQELDVGFRVLKCESSNMKDVFYNPSDYTPNMFESLTDNIKEDRTPEDLLFQVMLDLGILLSSKIEVIEIAGKKVYSVADSFLLACFDEKVTEDVIAEIAKRSPYYFVMRDSSMATDSVAANFEQIFDTYSPKTIRKVL